MRKIGILKVKEQRVTLEKLRVLLPSPGSFGGRAEAC